MVFSFLLVGHPPLVFAVLPPSHPPKGLGYSYTTGRQTSCLLQIDHGLVHLEHLDHVVLSSCSGVKDAITVWICCIFRIKSGIKIGDLDIFQDVTERKNAH
ncbi:hypothetical protein DPMN_111654 [Dreissena polymorpha]|uniref:Secreted protein n=1 Tax=Dreissena polymorpha TaxID=45954 RepID=A0A9D4QP18_DREPO|nr:hypothetical protein DPMN_111654 [Dreissena polymorpha]